MLVLNIVYFVNKPVYFDCFSSFDSFARILVKYMTQSKPNKVRTDPYKETFVVAPRGLLVKGLAAKTKGTKLLVLGQNAYCSVRCYVVRHFFHFSILSMAGSG